MEKEKLKISTESVRQLMLAEDLWKSRQLKKIVTHQLRERRACFGELVQIDGSPHDWFEGRAVPCVLLVFIDDATGQLVQLQFVERESFFSYSQAAAGYFKRVGKPVAFYSDKHSVFRVNQPSVGSRDAITQFARAMQELDIQIICANTPQAKGRVERANQTLQDRCPKKCACWAWTIVTPGRPTCLNLWWISTSALQTPPEARSKPIAPSPPKTTSRAF